MTLVPISIYTANFVSKHCFLSDFTFFITSKLSPTIYKCLFIIYCLSFIFISISSFSFTCWDFNGLNLADELIKFIFNVRMLSIFQQLNVSSIKKIFLHQFNQCFFYILLKTFNFEKLKYNSHTILLSVEGMQNSGQTFIQVMNCLPLPCSSPLLSSSSHLSPYKFIILLSIFPLLTFYPWDLFIL